MDPAKGIILEAPIGDSVITVSDDKVHTIPVTAIIQEDKVVKTAEEFTLPDNFSPTLHLIGRNPGYATLPWWIYQWILETPDWKSRPLSFEHPSAHQTLLSLIYYIKRDGSVQVRETRNSSFATLS